MNGETVELSTSQVLKVLGIRYSTLRQHMKTGNISPTSDSPRPRKGGGFVNYFLKDDVLALKAQLDAYHAARLKRTV